MEVNVHHARTHLSKLISAAESGEEVVIARNGKPAVKLVVIPKKTKSRCEMLGAGIGKRLDVAGLPLAGRERRGRRTLRHRTKVRVRVLIDSNVFFWTLLDDPNGFTQTWGAVPPPWRNYPPRRSILESKQLIFSSASRGKYNNEGIRFTDTAARTRHPIPEVRAYPPSIEDFAHKCRGRGASAHSVGIRFIESAATRSDTL